MTAANVRRLRTRALRRRCHTLFDALWRDTSGSSSRERLLSDRRELCYTWLAESLRIPRSLAHFSALRRADLLRALALLEGASRADIDAWERDRMRRADARFAPPPRCRVAERAARDRARIGITAAVLALIDAGVRR